MLDSIIAVTPTVVLTAAFFIVLRIILRADRNERQALAKLEAEYRAEEELSADEEIPHDSHS